MAIQQVSQILPVKAFLLPLICGQSIEHLFDLYQVRYLMFLLKRDYRHKEFTPQHDYLRSYFQKISTVRKHRENCFLHNMEKLCNLSMAVIEKTR